MERPQPTGHATDVKQGIGGDPSGMVVDPVCGMSVRIASARESGLNVVHEGVEYGFCGRGCRLEFGDDPARFLAPDYVPAM